MHSIAKEKLKRYAKAKAFREQWVPLFEECYDYSLPMRQSFYYEEAGQRRDEKIFDETAVVGVQEFASRLQAGIVPNFARWADLVAGSEIPKEQIDAHEVILHPRGFCNEHNKYKHRCPKCRELARMA